MALNNSKPLIFISRVDEADDDDERAQERDSRGGDAGCGCVGKMTLESSGNFGYFVWLPSRLRRSLRGAWRSDRNCSKCGHVQLAADK